MASLQRRSKASSSVAALAPVLGDERDTRLAEAFAAASGLPGSRARATALAELAPHLPDALVPAALDHALAIHHPPARAYLVAALAARLPEDLLEHALRTLSGPLESADPFAAIAPHLHERSLVAAIAATAHLSDPWARASALAELAEARAIHRTTLHEQARRRHALGRVARWRGA